MSNQGRLRLQAIPTESLYRSVLAYNLEGASVQARVVTTPPAADATVNLRITDGVNVARMAWNNGTTPTLTADWYNGTSWTTLTSIPYNATSHAFWRLRADTAANIYHETAPTASGPWTTIHSGVLGWPPTAVTVILGASTAATANGGWAELDDVNIIGVSISDTGTGFETARLGPIDADTGAGTEVAPVVSTFVTDLDAGVGVEPSPAITTKPADTGAGVDSATVAAPTPVSDTGVGSEASLTVSFVLPTESGVGVEQPLAVALAMRDQAAAAVDTATPAPAINAADTGTSNEPTPQITARPIDAGTGAETLTNTSPFVTEAGAGSDSAATAFTAPDAAAGVDTALPSVSVPTADTGAGTDTLIVFTVATVGDQATGAELTPAIASALPTDQGAGADTLVVRILVLDTGTGFDLLLIETDIPADTGTGGDAQTVLTGLQLVRADASSATVDALIVRLLLVDVGAGTDTTTGPGSVLPNFVRSFVRSTAGRTFVRSLERFPVWPTAL